MLRSELEFVTYLPIRAHSVWEYVTLSLYLVNGQLKLATEISIGI